MLLNLWQPELGYAGCWTVKHGLAPACGAGFADDSGKWCYVSIRSPTLAADTACRGPPDLLTNDRRVEQTDRQRDRRGITPA